MQAKKKSKKKPAAKSAPEKAKKTKQVKEEQNEKQPLLKTLIFGEEKPDLTELEAGSTTILDILSPTTVDTKSCDYIVVDGVFHTYLYVTGYGYTTTVGSCWLAPLVEAGEGVNIKSRADCLLRRHQCVHDWGKQLERPVLIVPDFCYKKQW